MLYKTIVDRDEQMILSLPKANGRMRSKNWIPKNACYFLEWKDRPDTLNGMLDLVPGTGLMNETDFQPYLLRKKKMPTSAEISAAGLKLMKELCVKLPTEKDGKFWQMDGDEMIENYGKFAFGMITEERFEELEASRKLSQKDGREREAARAAKAVAEVAAEWKQPEFRNVSKPQPTSKSRVNDMSVVD